MNVLVSTVFAHVVSKLDVFPSEKTASSLALDNFAQRTRYGGRVWDRHDVLARRSSSACVGVERLAVRSRKRAGEWVFARERYKFTSAMNGTRVCACACVLRDYEHYVIDMMCAVYSE